MKYYDGIIKDKTYIDADYHIHIGGNIDFLKGVLLVYEKFGYTTPNKTSIRKEPFAYTDDTKQYFKVSNLQVWTNEKFITYLY